MISVKQSLVIAICILSLSSMTFSACVSKNSVDGKMPSTSLEDYVTVDETIGNVHYRMADYSPMVEWFIARARGMADQEIEALYDSLPLIGDVDNFNSLPAEKKSKYILEISKAIIEEDHGYITTKQNFSQYSEGALREVFEYFAPMFQDEEIEIILVLNPFFRNGGMGVLQNQEDGQVLGRLEIGSARLASNPVANETAVRVWIAHEMTHVVHQYFGAADLIEKLENLPEHTDFLAANGGVYNVGLFSEGLAVYTSSLITGLDWNNTENYAALMFYDAYSSGPVLDNAFKNTLAKMLIESVEEKGPIDFELHGQWFSSRTPVEKLPVSPYLAPGYFLGAHIISTLVEDEGRALTEIFDRNVFDMLSEVNRVVYLLADEV